MAKDVVVVERISGEWVMDFYIARHPILNRKREIFAYELLYRSGDMEYAEIRDGELASTEVIINCFLHIGIDALVGTAPAFINVTEQFLRNENATPMFDTQVVLEIPRHIEVTQEFVEVVARVHDQGFPVSLKSLAPLESHPDLLQHVDYVKIDVLNHDPAQLTPALKRLQSFGIAVIADRVETPEMFERCHSLGFDYFQGYFFARPLVLEHHTLPANRLVVVNLFEKLGDPNVELAEIEALLAHDISLTYKFLRYVNSAAFALRCEISSIRQAVALIGLNKVRQWTSLILTTELAEGKPQELVTVGMVRAKMCELLAELHCTQTQSQMFILGLLSVLDALLDVPMVDLLDSISLNIYLKLALLNYSGENGLVLKRVIAYTEGRWQSLVDDTFDPAPYTVAYLEALRWADESVKTLFDSSTD